MARQTRSAATRQKILDAAVELFDEAGYSCTGLGEVIQRSRLTKGAFYYHFNSKEALATALIADASAIVFNTFSEMADRAGMPALEKLLHSSFALADLVTTVALVRTGSQLMRALGEFNTLAVRTYTDMQEIITGLTRQAAEEDDLSGLVPPESVAEVLVSTYLGVELFSLGSAQGADMVERLHRVWEVLLPAITAEDSLPFMREYLEREVTLRRRPR
ncbi:TetR/AcrR family transcriptional regulator [Mycolicibacterium palauense]|uniref:TetR/AcrR family transcriptional regulator n=1 Tax=Mycolicibacterium palauense TaxID=2034511 RepID=UPI000BFEAE4B|nr:TetR/AcrR family transcriptional regulator [Mycolicibacterium palauense]